MEWLGWLVVTAEREQLIDRARFLCGLIRAHFADCESYNTAHPRQEPIDPDPDGRLRDTLDALNAMIDGEARPH